MGRKSRAKRERRDRYPHYYELRRAARAEARGRRLTPTIDGYVGAFETRGEEAVIEALIARMNLRWDNARRPPRRLSDEILAALHVVYPLDVALVVLGADPGRRPVEVPGATWPDQLGWAIDSACQTFRLLMAGNVVGAAAVTRLQLERWSEHAIACNGVVRLEGESTADLYTRAWSAAYPGVGDVGAIWTCLSELLHGRGAMLSAVQWESARLCAPDQCPELASLVAPILDAVQLCLRQVRHCTALALSDVGSHGLADSIVSMPDTLPPEIDLAGGPSPDLLPYNLNLLTLYGPLLESHEVGLAAHRVNRS